MIKQNMDFEIKQVDEQLLKPNEVTPDLRAF